MTRAFAPVMLTALLACPACAASRRALIVSVDGCRPDALPLARTPNLNAVAARGSASYDARNILAYGDSGPNYSSMLTGVNYPKHGVTSNATNSSGFVGQHFDQWPNMYKRIRDFDPTLYTAQFYGWGPINAGMWADRYANQVGARGDSGNRDDVVNLLKTGNPSVIFWQISMVDSAGHSGAFSPSNAGYIAAIEAADGYVGQALSALYARPGYLDGSEEWLILLVTDHGGYNKSHSSPVPGHELEMQRTFFIVAGPGVAVGADIGSPRVYDVAPTVMSFLGMDVSGMDLDGRAVLPGPPILTAAASRKMHGDAGPFDLPLTLDGQSAPVECRSGGPVRLLLIFNRPVVAADGTLDGNELVLSTGTCAAASLLDNLLSLELANVSNGDCLTLTLNGLADAQGNVLAGPNQVRLRLLAGDVNGDGIVASADITQVKARSGQTAGAANFRFDVNADGIIASADITQVKSLAGHEAACP